MTTPSTHDMLLSTPVFQGMAERDLQEIVAQTKLGFEKYDFPQVIHKHGQRCEKLTYLMSGKIAVTTTSCNYSITEDISAPCFIEPERLFGIDNKWSRTVSALTPCNVLTLDKNEVLRLTARYTIFRLNLLNTLSTVAQRAKQDILMPQSSGFRQRFTRFITERCSVPYGAKHLRINRKNLTEELNQGLQTLTADLYELQAQGLINIRRGGYLIPDLKKLRDATTNIE